MLAILAIQTAVVAILATLGVADLYRQRQGRRFRVVCYPVRMARSAR